MTAGRRTPRQRRARIMAGVLAVALVGGLVASLAASLGGGGESDRGDDVAASASSTTMNTGGIEVSAPQGWTAIPIPNLGFGIAVPPGWEATVLSDEVLASLERAAPKVPGFVDLAREAVKAGAVFYAAGQDKAGRIADLKVRAAPAAEITGIDQLKAYARQLADSSGRAGAPLEVVSGADWPTVRIDYSIVRDATAATSTTTTAGQTSTTAAGSASTPVRAEGTETLVAGPDDILWSVIVTSEDPPTHDALAAEISDTLAFPPQ